MLLFLGLVRTRQRVGSHRKVSEINWISSQSKKSSGENSPMSTWSGDVKI